MYIYIIQYIYIYIDLFKIVHIYIYYVELYCFVIQYIATVNLTFAGSSLILPTFVNKEEVAWAAYDDDELPINNCCWGCGDCCGRIAPQNTLDKCIHLYNNPDEDDHHFQTTFDKCQALIEDDDEGGFRPGANAHQSRCWSYDVFQDLALLTETEFTRITKFTPQQAKRKPLTISFSGMSSNEKYYPVSMKGMALEDILTCRKIRLRMSDTATPLHLFTNLLLFVCLFIFAHYFHN